MLDGKILTDREKLLSTHRLLPLLPLVKTTFKIVGWTWNLEIEGLHNFEEVEELLKDFEAVDLGSYTFRYPVDKKGNPSVSPHFIVHIPTFCKKMDVLLESFEAAVMGLEVTKDQLLKAAYYAQNSLDEPYNLEEGDK